MERYFFRFSYIGSSYRGIQKQIGNPNILDIDCVQGALETALKVITPRSTCIPQLVVSSRTDAGVHALCTSAHVTLQNKYNTLYRADTVIPQVNKFLTSCRHEIRLLDWIPVTDQFHARHSAISRTYIYRFMVPKKDDDRRIPIAEYNRTHLVSSNLDIEKAKYATRLFMGRKDFTTFAAMTKENTIIKPIKYVRTLNRLDIEKANPLAPFDPLAESFEYWHVICSSKGFLYNQVRRIVATLLAVASDRITEKDINVMLQVPSHYNWNTRVHIVPPCGLYLVNVAYDEEELQRCTIPYSEEDNSMLNNIKMKL